MHMTFVIALFFFLSLTLGYCLPTYQRLIRMPFPAYSKVLQPREMDALVCYRTNNADGYVPNFFFCFLSSNQPLLKDCHWMSTHRLFSSSARYGQQADDKDFTIVDRDISTENAITNTSPWSSLSSSLPLSTYNKNEKRKNQPLLSFQEWLDSSYFDPDAVSFDDDNDSRHPPIVQWFAKLVQNDYETAEALFASAFIAILVMITQELVRFHLHR
jgi:hypothetical protein